jgi:hypothetical protein
LPISLSWPAFAARIQFANVLSEIDNRQDTYDGPTALARFAASSRTSFVYGAFGIRFMLASVPQFYETLAYTFFSGPQLERFWKS